MINDVVSQFKFLCSRTFLKASLHYTAAMLVLSDRNTVINARLENEISVKTSLMTAKIILVLGSLSSLEDHKQGLDYVISVHVNCQVNDLNVQAGNDLSKDLVINQMLGCELKTFHLLKRNHFVQCPFDMQSLTLDSIENAS